MEEEEINMEREKVKGERDIEEKIRKDKNQNKRGYRGWVQTG